MLVDFVPMNPIKPRRLALYVALLPGLLAGCRDERRHQASEVTTLEFKTGVVAGDAAPADVTRALLTRLAKAQRARAGGLGIQANREAYLATMAEVRGLAARTSIFETYRARGGPQVPRDLKEDGAVRIVTDGWVSICAYYADALEAATITPLSMTANSALVAADLTAGESNPRGPHTIRPTRIMVRFIRDADNSWRVNRVDLDTTATSLVGNPGMSLPPTPITGSKPAERPAG